jgi:hypothetical protein
VLVYPLSVSAIVGTDIFHAAALLWVAGFGHLVAGNVDLHAMAWLLVGSIPGVLITSKYTLRTPDNVLRLGLASVLFLSGLKLLNVPESNWVLAGGLIAAMIGFGSWALMQRPSKSAQPQPVPAELSD